MGRWGKVVALLLVVAGGCSSGGDDDADDGAKEADEPSETEALQAELQEMFDADQAERSGASTGSNDKARTDRLAEIIDEHGWPTFDLVGKEGATAAWTIAQHSDHDVEFQKGALALMDDALADDQVDPTEWAYLVDRVAVNEGRPQVYGTQGGCVGGKAEIGPVEDEANLAARRAEVGLQPLADYLAEFTLACAEEPAPE